MSLLAALLATASPTDLRFIVPLVAASPRQGRIGIGYKGIDEVRSQTSPAAQSSLDVADVDAAFDRIGQTTGPGSTAARKTTLGQLLQRATVREQTYLVRVLLGETRQGALEGVVLSALAKASRTKVSSVRRAVMFTGDLGEVAEAAMRDGEVGLKAFGTRLFRPIGPMLAQPASDVNEALTTWGRVALEAKLDGARIQVHKRGAEVRVFSRQLNDVTHSLPEVVDIARDLPVDACIADGEVLALDPTGAPRPFQETMRRFGRVRDVDVLRRELPLTPFFFDVMRVGSKELIDATTETRRRELCDMVPMKHLAPYCVTDDPDVATDFVDRVMAQGHEGVMAKALDAPYQAGKRGKGWLKIKPVHTLDLVVLAAEWGHGRRTGWLSNLHLGAYVPHEHRFAMLGKTFKGLTDAMLAWQTEYLQSIALGKEGHVLHVRPELVVEIAVNNIQRSPTYPDGLALRFARVKSYRRDKTPEQADTLATVRQLHEAESRRR